MMDQAAKIEGSLVQAFVADVPADVVPNIRRGGCQMEEFRPTKTRRFKLPTPGHKAGKRRTA